MQSTNRYFAIAAATAAFFAVASSAQAGGYAGNACVGKKQAALGKYTQSVAKAFDKYEAGADRNEAIAKAFAKVEKTWTKEEAKAVKKHASCNQSTTTALLAVAPIDTAISTLAGATEDYLAVGSYIGKAMKAYGKHIKDPVKDPGKVKLTAALSDASGDYLSGATVPVTTAANQLQADLVDLTTNAPAYPTTFQTIEPLVCTAGVCGGTAQACTANVDCSIHEYRKKEMTPTCVDGDPYIYFARKGTNNKVLMYYQGGGACWDTTSCYAVPGGTCARTAEANDNPGLTTTGFADYTNPANPFADWNVVFVTYCTCDVHWGDTVTVYSEGVANHRGRANAALVEKFAREHFVDPEQVFVTGSSAGSYGAIMNSYWLMKDVWPNADFAVLGDAGVGVITKQWLDLYIENWGVEENFPEDLPGVELPVTDLSLVDLVDGLAQAYPDARFANYDSSYDGGGGSQTNFFQVMRHPSPPGDFIADWPSWWEPACEWNACMREFKAENFSRAPENYRFFTGAGSRHTIFGSDKVFTETKSTETDGTPRTFVSWVTSMIANDADWVNVSCNNTGGDCNLTNSCQGGDNPGIICTSDADCTVGGSCQHDPDTANLPYNNDDTVTCPVTTCPCGSANSECFGGPNDGMACDPAAPASCPSGTCSFVNCSNQ